MNNATILVKNLTEMGVFVPLSEYYCNKFLYIDHFQKINIIHLEIDKRLTQCPLVPLWKTFKKIFQKHENFTNIIKMKHTQNQGIEPMDLCSPWPESFINNQNT